MEPTLWLVKDLLLVGASNDKTRWILVHNVALTSVGAFQLHSCLVDLGVDVLVS